MASEQDPVDLSLLYQFVLPANEVQESFEGLPCLYNPPSVIQNLRTLPLQNVVSTVSKHVTVIAPAPPPKKNRTSDVLYKAMASSKTTMKISSVIRSLLQDIAYHPLVKYWLAILAAIISFDFGTFLDRILWFVLGLGAVIIVNGALWGTDDDDDYSESEMSLASNVEIPLKVDSSHGLVSGSYWKSQGWMLTLPPLENKAVFPNYQCYTFHLRKTRAVFVRLDGPNLLISHPHPKHVIPKRRLWNDPIIQSEIIFVRHEHYNLFGSKVEIVPVDVPEKKVWSKKYPIALNLACRDRHLGKPASEDGVEMKAKSATESKRDLKGEVLKDTDCPVKTLFLFARTDREKDDWFRRLVFSSKFHPSHYADEFASHSKLTPEFATFIAYMKRACPTIYIPTSAPNPTTKAPKRTTAPTHEQYETVLIPNLNPPHYAGQNGQGMSSAARDHAALLLQSHGNGHGFLNPAYLNALLARVFYDFLRSPKWTHEIKQAIDRKLFFLRKPKVVESLKVKELNLGDTLPVINHVSSPVLDKQGLWVDLDIIFSGNVIITLEAFVNLLKVRDEPEENKSKGNVSAATAAGKKSKALVPEDGDDSGESSESEEDPEMRLKAPEDVTKERGSEENKGLVFKYADAIAKSAVMKNKHVQNLVGNLAATPFLLTVQVKKIVGSVALNVPPVPNNRVWVGFRSNPLIDINAKPKFGDRAVNLSKVSDWIKQKLLLEFQRVLVCPNMMDFEIPVMEFKLPK